MLTKLLKKRGYDEAGVLLVACYCMSDYSGEPDHRQAQCLRGWRNCYLGRGALGGSRIVTTGAVGRRLLVYLFWD